VTVQVPEQPAPQVTVNVPEQPPAQIVVENTVQVPEQPQPIVTLQMPDPKPVRRCGEQGLLAWMQALSERLRMVRVCCGDWTRVCGGRRCCDESSTSMHIQAPLHGFPRAELEFLLPGLSISSSAPPTASCARPAISASAA
jgi:hypothetical protein